MSVLIVVAHPDDEVLGCGGTAAALSAKNVSVCSCILSGDAGARRNKPPPPTLERNILSANEVLGGQIILGSFPNIAFNAVSHLELVQFIENAILQTRADHILTHHPQDLNDDHRITSRACQAAARLFQRRSDVPPLRSLSYVEVLSSTDWSFPSHSPFQPDTFFELREEFLSRKLEALAAYEGVMRPFPHPRSTNILRALAAYRGGQAGLEYAEAFQTAFRTVTCHSWE